MTPEYNEEITPTGKQVIWYEENGIRYSFVADPANLDYQAYLRWLEENEK